jgi:hypothetical protein
MKSIPFGYEISKEDNLTGDNLKSFMSMGGITKQLCQKGEVLWRVIPRFKGQIFSDYWIDTATMHQIMAILVSNNNFSNDAKVELFMNSLGILYKWGEDERIEKAKGDVMQQERIKNWKNELWKAKVTLKQDVLCYVGITAPQLGIRFDNSKEFKAGGFKQIVIPRFKGVSNIDAIAWADFEKPVLI